MNQSCVDVYALADRAQAIRYIHRLMRDERTARGFGDYETARLARYEAHIIARRYHL